VCRYLNQSESSEYDYKQPFGIESTTIKQNIEQKPTFSNGITHQTVTDQTATSLTDCTDDNPFYSESMPDFQNRKRTPTGEDRIRSRSHPASSKMPKKDNPPFFVYLTRAQKVEYQNDRIEPNIKKALYMFADPLKPTTFLTLTNDIKVLQTNPENSNVLIAQIAMKAKIDRLTSELQIFCNSHNVIIPSTELVECPQTPVLTPLLRAKLLPDKDSNVLKGHSKIGILEFKNWSLNYRKRK